MKLYFLLWILCMFMQMQAVVHQAYYPLKYYNSYIYPPHPQHIPVSLHNKKDTVLLHKSPDGNNYEHLSSVVSALLLGAGSGYLCKSCEPRALHQSFLLHILYLTVWGTCESSFMDVWLADLAAHDIKHNPSLIKHIAWIMSWVSYLI